MAWKVAVDGILSYMKPRIASVSLAGQTNIKPTPSSSPFSFKLIALSDLQTSHLQSYSNSISKLKWKARVLEEGREVRPGRSP